MMSNIRPESMARITNFELANAFIEGKEGQMGAAAAEEPAEETAAEA